MKKRNILLAAVTAAALSLTACGTTPSTAKTSNTDASAGTGLQSSDLSKADVTASYENVKLKKIDGTDTDLSSLLQDAELTVVNIWDPSCESCADEMKALSTISGQYAGKGVQVVGVIRGVTEKREEKALAMISETDANYLQLLDSRELDEQILDQFSETPTTIFLNRDGEQLGSAYTGAQDQAFWEKEIEKYHSQVCVNDHPAECAVG